MPPKKSIKQKTVATNTAVVTATPANTKQPVQYDFQKYESQIRWADYTPTNNEKRDLFMLDVLSKVFNVLASDDVITIDIPEFLRQRNTGKISIATSKGVTFYQKDFRLEESRVYDYCCFGSSVWWELDRIAKLPIAELKKAAATGKTIIVPDTTKAKDTPQKKIDLEQEVIRLQKQVDDLTDYANKLSDVVNGLIGATRSGLELAYRSSCIYTKDRIHMLHEYSGHLDPVPPLDSSILKRMEQLKITKKLPPRHR